MNSLNIQYRLNDIARVNAYYVAKSYRRLL